MSVHGKIVKANNNEKTPTILPFQVQLMLQEQQAPTGVSRIRCNLTQASQENSKQLLAPVTSTGRHRNHQMLLAAQSIYGGS